MMLIQIIIIFFTVFACANVVSRYKKNSLTLSQAILWLVFWLAAATVAIDPATSVYLAKVLGVGRGADVIIYLSLLILFYTLFRIQIKLEKMEREITKIVQDIALKKKQ